MESRTQVFDKNTLLIYLTNELSPNCNYKVETELTPDGCWKGKIIIEETSQDHNEDVNNYYLAIAENIKRCIENECKSK